MGSLADHKNAVLPGTGSLTDREIEYWAQKGGYVAGLGRIDTVEVWGHSYMAVTPPPALRTLLGARAVLDRALGGDTINRVFIAGRLDYLVAPHGLLSRPAGEAPVQVAPIMFGINDARQLDTTVAGNIERWGRQLQILIILTAVKPGDRYNAQHSSFTYGTGWTNSGTTQKTGAVGCGPITWTSWAGFPGGYVSFLPLTTARAAPGGLMTLTLNGVAKGTIDSRTTVPPAPYPDFAWYDTLRIYVPPDSVGGQQVIVGTMSGIAAGYQYSQGMALERGPRPITPVLKQPYPVDYSTAFPNPVQPTDALVDLFNAQIDTVVASFNDARVFTVDLERVFNRNPGLFSTDKLHPANPTGYQTMLAAVVQAVQANSTYLAQPPLP